MTHPPAIRPLPQFPAPETGGCVRTWRRSIPGTLEKPMCNYSRMGQEMFRVIGTIKNTMLNS